MAPHLQEIAAAMDCTIVQIDLNLRTAAAELPYGTQI